MNPLRIGFTKLYAITAEGDLTGAIVEFRVEWLDENANVVALDGAAFKGKIGQPDLASLSPHWIELRPKSTMKEAR
jgi:hypothetical protein